MFGQIRLASTIFLVRSKRAVQQCKNALIKAEEMRLCSKKVAQLMVCRPLLNLCFSLLLLTPHLAWAGTVMGDLAAKMQPGTWAELNTNGFDNGKFLEPCLDGSNIMEYADSATWDPISRQFLILGTTHGTCMGYRFAIYRDADNTWWKGPLPSDPGIKEQGGTWSHAYDHNTINPATGDVYYRQYNSPNVYKYTKGTWTKLPDIPSNVVYNNCCGALEYFPEMDGLVYVAGGFGEVGFFNTKTNQWSQLARGLSIGPYHNFIEYNPVHKVIIFGGGNDSRDIYKLDAKGTITKMKNAPADVSLRVVYGLISVDPVGGKYLVFKTDGKFYEYDVLTDTWILQKGTHPLAPKGIFEGAETPISTYGVNMFVIHVQNASRVYLYKHSSAADTTFTPPLTPSNLIVN